MITRQIRIIRILSIKRSRGPDFFPADSAPVIDTKNQPAMLFIPDRVFAFFSPHDLVAGRDLSGTGGFLIRAGKDCIS
jgi:hypothetical protein